MRDVLNEMVPCDLGMSNFDGCIDDGLAEHLELNADAVYAQYSGYNFCGYVWYDYEKAMFVCQVWYYNSPHTEIEEETLEDIMSSVQADWGYE